MSLHHAADLDSTMDSLVSTPRSDHHPNNTDLQSRVRFMCSFGGKILPRPLDNQLRYAGGDTRIVAVNRHSSYQALLAKLSKLSGSSDISVKYQLPNEDLDALISVTTDEDVENMMEEYDRLTQNQNPRSARLRLFLFNDSKGDDDVGSRSSSISSLLDGSANRDQWFLDALNSRGGGIGGGGGGGLERVRSEVSSVVSELPDYLFGNDNSDETQPSDPKLKTRTGLFENLPDPGSPAPVVSSPFGSTSSAPPVTLPSIPDLPPLKTKPDNPDQIVYQQQVKAETIEQQGLTQPGGYPGNPLWQYVQHQYPPVQQIPVYYVPAGNPPVQQGVPMQAQYFPQPGQTQFGYQPQGVPMQAQYVPQQGQMYHGGPPMRIVTTPTEPYDSPTHRVGEGANQQQVYYGLKNTGLVQLQSGMVAEGQYGTGSDANSGRVPQ